MFTPQEVSEKTFPKAGLSEAEAAYYPIPQREIDLNPNL